MSNKLCIRIDSQLSEDSANPIHIIRHLCINTRFRARRTLVLVIASITGDAPQRESRVGSNLANVIVSLAILDKNWRFTCQRSAGIALFNRSTSLLCLKLTWHESTVMFDDSRTYDEQTCVTGLVNLAKVHKNKLKVT